MAEVVDVARGRLPKIPRAQIARGIFRIGPMPTGNPRSADSPTSPFVMVGQERAVILEPGEEGQALPTLEACDMIGIPRDRIAYITISHIHLHHAEALNILMKETPAKVVCHQRAVPHLIDPTRLNASIDQVWGLEGGHCGVLNPVPEDRIVGCAGGEVFDLGEREFEIIDSRGHAPHHICVFDRLTRALWTGDMAGALPYGSERAGPDILPPLFDVAMSIAGIRRCRDLKPSILLTFTGIGGVSYAADQTLQWVEEDILAIERICRDGMKNGMAAKEIGLLVEEVRPQSAIGAFSPLLRPLTPVESAGEGNRSTSGVLTRLEAHMPPFGMLAYLKRDDPSLPWPEGMPGAEGAGRGY